MSRFSVPLFAFALTALPARAEEVTYNKHVAPILYKNCTGCHRPGEVGPFSLLTYKDAVKRADFIKDVTADRRMPPWKAEAGFGKFHDERRLSDAELKTLANWADTGTKEGDAKDLPPLPKFTDGWQLGEPDLVLKMPEAFTVSADGRDVFRCFVLPLNVPEDRTVAAVEFRPGNRRVVHHALFFLDSNGTARKKEKENTDKLPGFASFGGPGFTPTGGLGGWAPGAMPRPLPDGMGRLVRKGSDLVLQVHYHPYGKEEKDQSVVGVHFTKKKATTLVTGLPLLNRQFYIPAGDGRHKVTTTFTLPIDVEVIGIAPHMHLVGREMKVVAVKPDGKTEPLIWIKDWDFNWQGQYQYEKTIKLPKGTKLELEAFYDNSDKNPRNPSSPPKGMRWGEQTTDEMCLCAVQIATTKPAELLELFRELLKQQAAKPGKEQPK